MLLLLALAALLYPTPPGPSVEISWHPKTAVQGSFITLTVRPAQPWSSLRGRLAGEWLHFQPVSGGFRAVAAIPLEAMAPVPAAGLLLPEGDAEREITFSVPVKKGAYRTQRLSVASRYGREPDAATRARIEREAAKARQVSENSHHTPRMWKLPFLRPASGRITSPFGTARVFNGQVKSRHTGLDYGGGTGAPVKAANDGVVALVDSFYLGGNCIYLDHGAGMITAYLHLSKWYVKAGQSVKKGQLIGRIGATGRVTGPHLHFIARYGKISVNPLSLFQLSGL